MSPTTPIVFVVDDDISVRESLELLIRNAGWQPELLATAQEFLARPRVLVPSCLVLDVTLPGLNGLELQARIGADRTDMPIIFITGHGDVMRELRDRHASLSRREREVMALVVCGKLNKQVGGELGISEITVKAHRGRAMRKMKADSLAELVNMAARLRLAPAPRNQTAVGPQAKGRDAVT